MILEPHRQGLKVAAIARQLRIDRKTVRHQVRRPRPRAAGLRTSPATRPCHRSVPAYLQERLAADPTLTAVRLGRELMERGFAGASTAVKRAVATIRPTARLPVERRFEAPPGPQAQVGFARFEVTFADEPGTGRIVWRFALVLGPSRLIWARSVVHQRRQRRRSVCTAAPVRRPARDLPTLLRCHVAVAFADLGGVPRAILDDRMKAAVTGEDPGGPAICNRTWLGLARHDGFQPRACRPCRAKTTGKVGRRPFRCVREDFFLARAFRDLEDLHGQLRPLPARRRGPAACGTGSPAPLTMAGHGRQGPRARDGQAGRAQSLCRGAAGARAAAVRALPRRAQARAPRPARRLGQRCRQPRQRAGHDAPPPGARGACMSWPTRSACSRMARPWPATCPWKGEAGSASIPRPPAARYLVRPHRSALPAGCRRCSVPGIGPLAARPPAFCDATARQLAAQGRGR